MKHFLYNDIKNIKDNFPLLNWKFTEMIFKENSTVILEATFNKLTLNFVYDIEDKVWKSLLYIGATDFLVIDVSEHLEEVLKYTKDLLSQIQNSLQGFLNVSN
jgi:hypothetical protein